MMPKAKQVTKTIPTAFEPWVKTAVIIKLFSVSYGFISLHTKDNPTPPDMPVMPHMHVGREMRFRISEVQTFFGRYERWEQMKGT